MQRTKLHIMTMAVAATLLGCPNNNANVGDSTDTGGACNPGEQNCECNNGLCLVGLECVNDTCIDPNCTPGTEFCECAEGNLCFMGLECIGGICQSEGGDECTPEAYFHCFDYDVYWFDSCDQPGELKDDCDPDTQNCVNTGDMESYCVSKTGTCDDGVLDPGEDCDGNDLAGQTCQSLGYADGDLACTSMCAFDESNCTSCGNGVVDDPAEECDGLDLQQATCESLDFDDGALACLPNCQYDLGACTSCDCSSGECCENGCDFSSADVTCNPEADLEYGCPSGTDPGDDVSVHARGQSCSGMSASCDGALGPWEAWQPHEDCEWNEYCAPGDSSCNACAFTYDVTLYECPQFSPANGQGLGGGMIFNVCATTDSQTGYMTVKARKFDNTTFGSRPYQVRVSLAGDDPCGPNAWFFVVSDSDPVGIGTNELTFSFPAQWQPDQWEKAYCVTASTKVGDLGYDGNNPQQQSWWYSDKAETTRECN